MHNAQWGENEMGEQKLNTKSVFSLSGFICVVVCSLV